MSSPTSPIICDFQLPEVGVKSIANFMATIEQIRVSFSAEDWRTFCKQNAGLKDWISFLCEDPYTSRALAKPRGYAGDAVVMDLAYKHKSCATTIDASSDTGRLVYNIVADAAQSRSARTRIALIADEIKRQGAIQKLRIVSFASGHGRELEWLDKSVRQNIDMFYAVDSDKLSLTAMQYDYGALIPITPMPKSVFRLKDNDIPQSHLVYSLGLFDYLNDDAALRIVEKMSAVVRPGGRLIIGNLSEKAGNLGYCEAVMDWWMIARSTQDMQKLAAGLPCNQWRHDVVNVDCFNYLVADRMGRSE